MGTGPLAERTVTAFPLDMTYTAQKSGAFFTIVADTSGVLNFLQVAVDGISSTQKFFSCTQRRMREQENQTPDRLCERVPVGDPNDKVGDVLRRNVFDEGL